MRCTAPGCERPAAGYSRLCRRHRGLRSRNGAFDQQAVRASQLQPYAVQLRAAVALNGGDEAATWAKLEALFSALAGHARALSEQGRAGKGGSRKLARAAQELALTAAQVAPRDAVETAIAILLMHEHEPRAFVSHDAFLVQVCRRFMALAPDNVLTKQGANGKQRSRVRSIPREAAIALGRMLVETFGAVAARIADAEAADSKRLADAKAAAANAFAAGAAAAPAAPQPAA